MALCITLCITLHLVEIEMENGHDDTYNNMTTHFVDTNSLTTEQIGNYIDDLHEELTSNASSDGDEACGDDHRVIKSITPSNTLSNHNPNNSKWEDFIPNDDISENDDSQIINELDTPGFDPTSSVRIDVNDRDAIEYQRMRQHQHDIVYRVDVDGIISDDAIINDHSIDQSLEPPNPHYDRIMQQISSSNFKVDVAFELLATILDLSSFNPDFVAVINEFNGVETVFNCCGTVLNIDQFKIHIRTDADDDIHRELYLHCNHSGFREDAQCKDAPVSHRINDQAIHIEDAEPIEVVDDERSRYETYQIDQSQELPDEVVDDNGIVYGIQSQRLFVVDEAKEIDEFNTSHNSPIFNDDDDDAKLESLSQLQVTAINPTQNAIIPPSNISNISLSLSLNTTDFDEINSNIVEAPREPEDRDNDAFVSMSQVIEYTDSKRAGTLTRWFCPFDGLLTEMECTKSLSNPSFNGWKGVLSLHNHIKNKHIATRDPVPPEYYTKHRKEWCNGCQKLYAVSNRNKHSDHIVNEELSLLSDDGEPARLLLSQQLAFIEQLSMDEILRYQINQIQSVPAALHRQWIDLIDDMLEKLRINGDLFHWKLFNMIPKVIWHTSLRSGKKSAKKRKANWIRRIEMWHNQKYIELWNEFKNEWEEQNIVKQRSFERNRLDPSDIDYHNKLQRKRANSAIYYARNGDLSGGSRAMQSFGMMELTDDNIQLIHDLHPYEDELKVDPGDYIDIQQIQLQPKTIRTVIKSAKRTTSGGLAGWRPIYWKPIIGDHKESHIIVKLTEVTNRILDGNIRSEIIEWFAHCKGTLLAKDLERTKGRPIATGLGLRRLITKGIVIEILDETNNILFPIGIGSARNGCELAIHSIRAAMKHYGDDDDISFLSVDEKNAFNAAFRSKIRLSVMMFTPQIIVFWDLIYCRHSKIWYTESLVIISRRGYQQGDGLASFGFGLLLLMTFKDDKQLLMVALMIWYHDDGVFVCKISEMDYVLTVIFERSKSIGLDINRDKTTIYTKQINYQLDFVCTTESHTNIPLLGSFIGDRQSTANWLDDKITQISHYFDTISFIDDPQIVASYLYYTTNYGKLMHILRTIPPVYTHDFGVKYDALLRTHFQRVIQSPIGQRSWNQISLGFSLGGVGLRAPYTHNIAAYLSSINQSQTMIKDLMINKDKYDIYDDVRYQSLSDIEYENALHEVRELEEQFMNEYDIEDRNILKDQKSLSSLIDQKQFKILLNQCSISEAARLNACSAPSAASWISCIPTYGNILKPKEFIICMRMWCGVPLFIEKEAKCKVCGAIADVYGYHFIVCMKTNGEAYGRTSMHNYIRNWFFHLMRSAMYNPELEKHGIAIECGKLKPADIYCPLWDGCIAAALDIGISSPLRGDILVTSASEILAAGDQYEQAKYNFYLPKVNPLELKYIPVVIESFGGLTATTESILKKICYDLRSKMKMSFSHLVNLKRKQLSLKIWKCNTKLVLARIPFNV